MSKDTNYSKEKNIIKGLHYAFSKYIDHILKSIIETKKIVRKLYLELKPNTKKAWGISVILEALNKISKNKIKTI